MQYKTALQGATLVEVLIVLALCVNIAAIVSPSFTNNIEKARAMNCLSNERQISVAMMQYVSDHDQTYPMGQTVISGKRTYWTDALSPYYHMKPAKGALMSAATLFNCPSFPVRHQAFNYGVHAELCPDFDKTNPAWDGGTTVVPISRIDSPSELILIVEKGANGADAMSAYQFNTAEWNWIDGLRTNPLHHVDLDPGSGDCDTPAGKETAGQTCDAMPRYRHNGACNVVFADGHAKAMARGAIDWYKNVYGNPGIATNAPYNQSWYPTN